EDTSTNSMAFLQCGQRICMGAYSPKKVRPLRDQIPVLRNTERRSRFTPTLAPPPPFAAPAQGPSSPDASIRTRPAALCSKKSALSGHSPLRRRSHGLFGPGWSLPVRGRDTGAWRNAVQLTPRAFTRATTVGQGGERFPQLGDGPFLLRPQRLNGA